MGGKGLSTWVRMLGSRGVPVGDGAFGLDLGLNVRASAGPAPNIHHEKAWLKRVGGSEEVSWNQSDAGFVW